MKEERRRSYLDCEYLVGDNSCGAIKESGIFVLRADACYNDIKDMCCYLCSLRRSCEIGCDLAEHLGSEKRSRNTETPEPLLDLNVKMECVNCVYYLKPKCPRGYTQDTELWRRQEPCEIFKAAPKTSRT